MIRNLLLLTAPPASGKTFWIQNLITELGHEDILVISPLRALANECHLNWEGKVLVMTPEEWITKKITKKFLVFDEFHLNFYWGDTFRPLLWDVFYELSEFAELTILLTATLSGNMKVEIAHFSSQFDQIIWVDQGNQTLKYQPSQYVCLPSKKMMRELIMLDYSSGTKLIFCEFREEVYLWTKILEGKGRRVWSCVGGEAQVFSNKVQSDLAPEFIIATTVLSHGVNLPQITKVYFLYKIQNLDFWIQMVARGGRKGEKFEVYSLENPYGIKWSKWINYLAILKLRSKISYHEFTRQLSQWFLKD